MKRKIICMLLVAIMVVSMWGTPVLAEERVEEGTGRAGDNETVLGTFPLSDDGEYANEKREELASGTWNGLNWIIYEEWKMFEGWYEPDYPYISITLVISGKGEMGNFTADSKEAWRNDELKSIIGQVVIEEGVTSIGDYAFSDCDGIDDVEIAASVETIGSNAFSKCDRLGNIRLPEGIIRIKNSAFSECGNLRSVMLPDGVKIIESEAFRGCYDLGGITIPDTVTEIGASAFEGCFGFGYIHFDGNVPVFGENAFANVTATAYYSEGNKTWTPDVLLGYGGELTWLSWPQEGTADNLTWRLDENGTLIISGQGPMNVANPEELWGDPKIRGRIKKLVIEEGITTIGDFAFSGCYNLSDIVIPNGVTTIGTGAFIGCNMSNIKLPEEITTIGRRTFYSCKNLTSIIFPDKVEKIGEYAFADCSKLASITYSPNIMEIGEYAFAGCESLTGIELPDGITSISRSLFQGCRKLDHVIIPEGVTSIGEYAFSKCKGLTDIELPDGVRTIEEGTFQSCESLKNITYSEKVEMINKYAFCGCESLQKIIIPEGLEKIGKSAFDDCKSLKEIIFPDSLRVIEQSAFYHCSGLKNVILPANVAEIGENAFGGCTNLEAVEVAADNQTYASETGVLFDKSRNFLMVYPPKKNVVSYDIPNGITAIGEYAFSGCEILKKVGIPDSVEIIDSYAFDGCINLTDIRIPGSILTIDDSSFNGCSSLTAIDVDADNQSYSAEAGVLFDKGKTVLIKYPPKKTDVSYSIPNNIMTIGTGAFADCISIISVSIPETVTMIERDAFSGCRTLKSVYFKGDAPKFEDHAFGDVIADAYYPVGNETWTQEEFEIEWHGGKFVWKPWSPTGGEIPPSTDNKPSGSDQGKDNTHKQVLVSKITISGLSKKIAAGKKVRLSADITPSNASNKKIKWLSGNPKVASVSSSGTVTMKKSSGGKSVTIIAEALDGSGKKATYRLTSMKGIVKKIAITGKTSVKAGKSLKLKATVTASKKANKKLKWTSSNKKYAAVSSTGKVETHKAGKNKRVKITAAATDGSGKKKAIMIKIK